MTPTTIIRYGDIVFADVCEPNNGPPAGPHPVIVVSSNQDIDSGRDLNVVVCSRSNLNPPKSGWFKLDTKPGGHEITGLDKACFAKATWLQTIPQALVIRKVGRAQSGIVRSIQNWLMEQRRNMLRQMREPRE